MLLVGLVPLLAAGCRSSASAAPAPTSESAAALPEIRYYMIADT
jgi:hypothetical protein